MPRRSANELTLPAELVARFRRDVEELTQSSPGGGGGPRSGGGVVATSDIARGDYPSVSLRLPPPPPGEDFILALAISGGPDSLALLLLAAAAFPGRVIAATVDHGLRPEAAEEARFVADICAALDAPHQILTGTMPAGNLQESARTLRYALLAEWVEGRAGWLATAHQQDDLAETLLMRARRGAGVSGLAAMRSALPLGSVTLIRPLLGWSRIELGAIVAAANIAPVHDPSNHDPRFDRARIRTLLAESSELPTGRLALAAHNLRRAEDALEWVAEREWQARSRIEADSVMLDADGLPYELRRRLVERAVNRIRAGERPALRGESLDRLVATLDAGGTGTIAGVKAGAKYAEWRFSAAPARRSH